MSEGSSPWVRDVSEADFERDVLEASRQRPVVDDFWAPWCQPCLMLAPVLERLVAERGGEVLLAKVDIDQAQGLAALFRVSTIPAVMAFRDGVLVHEFKGLLPEPYLRQFLDEILPGEADRLVKEARGREEAEPAAAERLYRQALEKDRNNPDVRVGLARALLAQDRIDEVPELLEPVGSEGEVGAEAGRLTAQVYFRRAAQGFPDEKALRQRLGADPENAQVRYELGCVLARNGDYAAALEMLLSAGERDPKLAATKVREAMVQVFYALGSDHPLANEYRAKLTRLLY